MEALLQNYDGITRTAGPTHMQLSDQRREHNRIARTPAHRKELLEKRVAIAKRAKAILADPQWKKKLAVADSGIEAARKELTEAEKPFKRLEAAKAGLHNAESGRAAAEGGQRAALVSLGREADGFQDFVLGDICAELQIALDETMKSRSANAVGDRARLQRALEVAAKLPYEFRGSWRKYEALLVGLKKLAESRGCEAMASPQWGDDDAILGETE
jgi:hypothetical protein